MARLLDQRPAADLADFVDAVAEGERPIVDRHRGLGAPDISAVDICDARHAPSPKSLAPMLEIGRAPLR